MSSRTRNLRVLAAVCALTTPTAASAHPQTPKQVVIQPGVKARLLLQSRINSKLNEVGDAVTATLTEPVYADGQLALARGAEFHGRVTAVKPAGKAQKAGRISIIFDKVAEPWGEEPVDVMITAIDDWNSGEKLKANSEGKVGGGHSGERTVDNAIRGGTIGALGAGAVILSSGGGIEGAAAPAGGGLIGGGLLAGVLLTKGGDVRLDPGAVFRIEFVKPKTLPVVEDPNRIP